MERFDYILAGGGAAGLSLAYHMMHGGLDDKRVLIVDLATKNSNDRTWCYWSDTAELFDPIVSRRWSHLWFHGPERSHRWALNPYTYNMIRGIDFYRFTRADLEARENVQFLNARVRSVEDGDTRTGTPANIVLEDGRRFSADWVFDSLFLPKEFAVDTRRYHFLKQHFTGWFVKASEPVFDPDAVTMFDLRVPSRGDFRFMYLLPVSPYESLVEYTLFSSTLLKREEYERELEAYMNLHYPGVAYEIEEREDGIIPMTEQPFPRRGGSRIMFTGTKGGRVKASTGFAFLRTQRDCERIVRSLRETGQPFHDIEPPKRYKTFDAMMLSVLDRRGDFGRGVFADLFEKNPLVRLWRFLDEEGSLGENIKLMSTVPWIPFIAAGVRVTWRRLSAAVPRPSRRAATAGTERR